MKSYLVIFLAIALLCAFDTPTIMAQQNTTLPPAIVFVHGLGGSEITWRELLGSLDALKYVHVSNYRIQEDIQYKITEEKKQYLLDPKDETIFLMFTVTFEDNQNLGFQEQGARLRDVVDRIRSDYPGRNVILFGHSMGGLASRACIMQNTEGIIGLVTVGTPHEGSLLAYTPKIRNALDFVGARKISGGLEGMANSYDLSLSSKAIGYLAPDSKEMRLMYNQVFPEDIPAINVVYRITYKITGEEKEEFARAFVKSLTVPVSYLKLPYQIPLELRDSDIQLISTDGVVSVPSQKMKHWVANPGDIEVEVIEGSNWFHTDEPEDIVTMQIALNRIIELTTGRESPKPSSGKINLGFILDSSGSMKESDPSNIRLAALRQIIDRLFGNENFFLVDFDGSSTWLTNDSWRSWNKVGLKHLLDNIDSDGSTNVALGMETMQRAMESSLKSYEKTAVVMLTDGQGYYNNNADWFARNNIKVYTISYKDMADAKLLESIASSTGGVYLQANNEQEVVAAFMQFYDDLQGNSKFLSFKGTMMDKIIKEIPHFFVDNGATELICNINWSKVAKDYILISPSGRRYAASKTTSSIINRREDQLLAVHFQPKLQPGPNATSYREEGFEEIPDIQWTAGSNYLFIKIKNPEAGQWSGTIRNKNGQPSSDDFLFEAGGMTPYNIRLQEKEGKSGYFYSFIAEPNIFDWSASTATILMESPDHRKTDISSNYKSGVFSFYPLNGKGNYNINAMIQLKSRTGDIIQRSYNRSKFIGEILPGYLAPVKEITGTYIISDQGSFTGNRPGIRCVVYAPGGSRSEAKASGSVISVNDNECTIKIATYSSGELVKPGDIVELDLDQWQNDH